VNYSVDGVDRWRGIGVLIGYTVFYRIIFYVMLITRFNGQRKD
jgi:hypothetical protein